MLAAPACATTVAAKFSDKENTMQIQINTDRNVHGHEALAARIDGEVVSALSRHRDYITRVEVHLSDENAAKGGKADKRCMMEARLQGRQPVAVTHHAETLDQAVSGAAGKLSRLVESTLGRVDDRADRAAGQIEPGTRPPEA